MSASIQNGFAQKVEIPATVLSGLVSDPFYETLSSGPTPKSHQRQLVDAPDPFRMAAVVEIASLAAASAFQEPI